MVQLPGIHGYTSIYSYKRSLSNYRNVHKSVFNALDLTQQSANILPMYRSDKSYQYLAPLIDTKNVTTSKTRCRYLSKLLWRML